MKPTHAVALSGLCLSLLLVACGGGSTDSMLASAKDYLDKNDNKAAVIQIKNALQKDPESGPARLMLGQAMMKTGEVPNAELEFRKALDLKVSPDQVAPELARALLALAQFKKVVDEFAKTELGSATAKADLQTSLSTAYAALGKADLSQAALTAALTASPTFAPALVAVARQKAVAKDYDGALASVEDIIAKNPTNFEAWRLKGDVLLLGKNQLKESLVAYRKVLELKPEMISAHATIITLMMSTGDLDESAKQIEQLKKVAPNNPQTKYFQAQLAYLKRDFKVAREMSQQVLKMVPNNAKALQLAGAVEFQSNSLVQAETYLSKAVTTAPELVLARRLLIMTYLRSNQATKALTALNQGFTKGIVDPEINSVAGEVYLQNGDVKKAEEYFEKAAKLAPKDARKRTSLALTHMMTGNTESAFGELQEIAASDTGITADMALISANLRKGEWDKALKAIDGLEKKQPDKPLAANLRGRTLLAKKDTAGARASFEKALKLDPKFFPAVASLAGLDMMEKKPADAKKRFEAVLAQDPKSVPALLALAEMAARNSAPKEEIGGLITRAVEANAAEAAPRVLLINFHLSNKDFKQAMSVAQNAVAALPESPDILESLGLVQIASGEHNQAVATFTKLVAMLPQATKPLLRLADAHMAAKNKDAAGQSLRKALEVKPDLIDAQRGVIMLSMDAKKFSDAVAMAKTVQKQRPKEPIGFVLEGDVAAAQKNWDGAVTAYQAGIKQAPSPELALKSHAALMAGGKTAEADKFSAAWIKDNAKDYAFLFYMGDFSIARKDYATAEKHYSAVVKLQPNNAAAFNNLAWVTGRLNKPGAVELAESAIKLAPTQPAFMDTLAMLLSEKNDYAKAVEWQTKALAAQPDNTLFKMNLARIHIKGNKKELARKPLDELAKLGDKFPAQAEVASLLKGL